MKREEEKDGNELRYLIYLGKTNKILWVSHVHGGFMQDSGKLELYLALCPNMAMVD